MGGSDSECWRTKFVDGVSEDKVHLEKCPSGLKMMFTGDIPETLTAEVPFVVNYTMTVSLSELDYGPDTVIAKDNNHEVSVN